MPLQLLRAYFTGLIIVFCTSQSQAQVTIQKPSLTKEEYSASKSAFAKLGFPNLDQDYSIPTTLAFLHAWDSLNTNHHNSIYNQYPAKGWQAELTKRYQIALAQKNVDLSLKIAYPLAFVCHSRSDFKNGFIVLTQLYANKNKLTNAQLERVLIKLEETYRHFSQMKEVIKIRNERIEKGFIKTFWELYISCGLEEEAIQDYLLFEPIPQETSKKRITYFLRLGELFLTAHQLDSAEKYFNIGYQETLQIRQAIAAKKINDDGDYQYYLGLFKGYIGKIYMEKGQYQKAEKLLQYFLSVSNPYYKINSYYPLSVCYIKLGQLDKAKKYLDSTFIIYDGRFDDKSGVELLKIKSDYFKAIGQKDSALEYLQLYDIQKGKITSMVLKNQSALLTGKMEIEKRRKELVLTQNELVKTKLSSSVKEGQLYLSIAGLVAFLMIIMLILRNLRQEAKSKQLIEAKNKLLEQYAEKNLQKSHYNEQLIKELHHRVKNNLQNVYSLLNIQKRRIQDKETIEFVNSIQDRITAMAIVHESLYAANEIELIDFKAYTIKLVEHIHQSFQKEGQDIQALYAIEPIKISLEKIILLGLIINETVSNVYKHATDHIDPVTLHIQLVQMADQCTLTIQDNGPGFELKEVHSNSLGLKLIQMMCQQLEASYTLHHQKGVTHIIRFNI